MNNKEEYLDVYNEEHEKIGTALRSACHAQGFLHQVVHCWMSNLDGSVLYFQQRAFRKADFPGYYDLACGGHISAGEDAENAVLREIMEETGLSVGQEQLMDLGALRTQDCVLEEFYDREIARVYLMLSDDFAFRPGEEVEQMVAVRRAELADMLSGKRADATVRAMDGAECSIPREKWCLDESEFAFLLNSGKLPN